MRVERDRNARVVTSLRYTHRNIQEVTKTLTEMRMTSVGDMLPSAEGGETAARAIIAPELLREGDMVDVVRVEGGPSGYYAPFWLRAKVRRVECERFQVDPANWLINQ